LKKWFVKIGKQSKSNDMKNTKNCIYIFIKRILDLLFTFLFLPFLFIIFIIIAPIIYFSDRGPVFYNAYRMGKCGKRFTMYKFRSMKVNAPDLRNPDGSTFNSEDDPRVTKIGKFMRKTSIDELPQILNVLKGDMSIVGPRPTLYSGDYSTFDEQTKKRYVVRPGITGYTQAYFRNSIGQDEKFKHDAWYVDNLSFMLDVKVIFKTFFSVVKQKDIFVSSNT
jgi:undecaprenyl phosphate N,N'-diacetylbacillosamine 1-phosphate transferase